MGNPEKSTEKASSIIKRDLMRDVEEVTQRVFGCSPTRVAMPGGKSRAVFIVEVDQTPYVIAKRSNKYDAKVEATVLKALSGPELVPGYIGKHGRWIVQEFVSGIRLPVLIDQATSEEERARHARLGLDSLLEIQKAADRARLRKDVPRLGVVDGWASGRLGAVDSISEQLSISAPELNRTEIIRLFSVTQTDFIKWDARPGNAMVDGQNVRWFDWEDCGRRNRIDDLVCFLADEWMAISSETEKSLVTDYLPLFRRALGAEWSERYFYIAGSLQLLFRLKLALDYYHRDGEWWDRAYCLSGDKVGVTPEEVDRLLHRLWRWSGHDATLQPFQDWSEKVRDKLGI